MDDSSWSPEGFNPNDENVVKELQQSIKTKVKEKLEHLADLEKSLEEAKNSAKLSGNKHTIFNPDALKWDDFDVYNEEVADLEEEIAKTKTRGVWPKSDDIEMHIRYNQCSVHLLCPSEEAAMNDLVASGSWKNVKLEGSTSWRRSMRWRGSMKSPTAEYLYLTMSSPCSADTTIPASFTGLNDLKMLVLNISPTCQDRQFLHSSFFPVEMITMSKLKFISLNLVGPDDVEEEEVGPSKKKQKNDECSDESPVLDAADDRTFPNVSFIDITVKDPTSSIHSEYIDDMLRYIMKHFPNVTRITLKDVCLKEADSRPGPPTPSRVAMQLLDLMQDESVMEPKLEANQQAAGKQQLRKKQPPPLSKLEILWILFCGLDEKHLKVLLCDILVPFKKKWYPNIEEVLFHGNAVSTLIPIASELTQRSKDERNDDTRTTATQDNLILRKLIFNPKHMNESIQRAAFAEPHPAPEDFPAWLENRTSISRAKIEEESACGLTIVGKLGLESFGFVTESSGPRFKELFDLNATTWRCKAKSKRALKIVESIKTNGDREQEHSKCNCKWKGTHMCKIVACCHLLEQVQKKKIVHRSSLGSRE
mmetsp:Transcript_28888/g.69844  ORF Transcript_28888/g.69844 Transcript_28888/m.69844 type:complete len:592 (-) Transcript_28888:15-1790(-)